MVGLLPYRGVSEHYQRVDLESERPLRTEVAAGKCAGGGVEMEGPVAFDFSLAVAPGQCFCHGLSVAPVVDVQGGGIPDGYDMVFERIDKEK